MNLLRLFRKTRQEPVRHPADVAMEKAFDICDQVNDLYASGDLPRGVRFWFNFDERPVRMVVEKTDFQRASTRLRREDF